MTIERRAWLDETEEDTRAAGNGWIKVFDREGGIIWEGWAVAFNETTGGSIIIKRRVNLDPETGALPAVMDTTMIGPGWQRVEDDGFILDLENLRAQLAANEQAERERQAAEKLGLIPPNGQQPPLPPGLQNRQQRRHPGQ